MAPDHVDKAVQYNADALSVVEAEFPYIGIHCAYHESPVSRANVLRMERSNACEVPIVGVKLFKPCLLGFCIYNLGS